MHLGKAYRAPLMETTQIRASKFGCKYPNLLALLVRQLELAKNLYEVLGVAPSASALEIRLEPRRDLGFGFRV